MIHPQENADLTALNSFAFEARAQYLIDIEQESDIADAVAFTEQKQLPLIVFGGGSNLILDPFLPAVVIRFAREGYRKLSETDADVLVEVEAGHNWHQLVLAMAREGWHGLENLALIPGTVGAAPVQNIGAYGVELKDRFVSLTAFDQESRHFVELSAEQCNFAYRNSIFKSECPGRYIISRVRFRLSKEFVPLLGYGGLRQALDGARPTAEAVLQTVVSVRQSKLPDPAVIGNAGSFFENPIIPDEQFAQLKTRFPDVVAFADRPGYTKLAAGWLIDQAGWKGYRQGAVGVYDKQALVLVNHGGGDAKALMALAAEIQRSVAERYGVNLVPEPRRYPKPSV